jgi:hypothetical protein
MTLRLHRRERLQDVVPMLRDSEVTAVRPDHDLTDLAGYEVDIDLLHQRSCRPCQTGTGSDMSASRKPHGSHPAILPRPQGRGLLLIVKRLGAGDSYKEPA